MSLNDRIPVFRPYLGAEEIAAVTRTLESRWIGLGPRTIEFEKMFAEYLGCNFAIGVSSCTDALQLGLLAHDITEGEVIVPSFTFVATSHAVFLNGLKPVLVDCNEDDFCMNLEEVRKNITPRTKAIIPVHYGGHPCNMPELVKIAEEFNLVIIEDVAHSLGASIGDKKVGTFGHIGAFSFQATKSMTTGEGGMLVTNDEKIAQKVRQLRWFGISKDTFERSLEKFSWYYEIDEMGLKANMNDIIASIGIEQLKKLDKRINSKKTEIARWYDAELSNLSEVILPSKAKWANRIYWNYAIKCNHRDNLSLYLSEKGIDTSVHYLPVHMHPVYIRLSKEGLVKLGNLDITEKIWKQVLSLPMFPDLKHSQVKYICDCIKEFYNQKK